MGTPASGRHGADAAGGGVRLTVPVRAGTRAAEIGLEPAHCERLFRMAAYLQLRAGRLDPAAGACARLVAGRVRDRHGEVRCLESCAVEVCDAGGRTLGRVEFPGEVFAAFAAARALHLARRDQDEGERAVAWALHAVPCDDMPLPVALPLLPALSVAALTGAATACGEPAGDWAITLVTDEALEGLAELARRSRASGLEEAGRIPARVGFDPERRLFVRILERLSIARATTATALSVVSTAASWARFLAEDVPGGARALASAHTHLHLGHAAPDVNARGDRLLAGDGALGRDHEPVISIDDLVTHYAAFPDPLSMAVIVSVFPERTVTTLYGYTTGARLRVEPGYWRLGARAAA